ncbi:hypothetical protein TEA_015794 [Camellia sinensis var. sinensis]|uniref:AP2/ERF domain-containing protein n=1 Tax=Camellia sinensis var. sinensis TaxID=542762 RepID=A0A4S4E8I7_CAMSN|nr:hypothetical protein TEA_026237 [Camellia sinensis var. sinensis]THG12398.1 hypothetical protein TEA_015794 [Camellia sinensis var. sinensis]
MNIEAAALLGGAQRDRKCCIDVWQRPLGRSVAKIKDTIQKIRVWWGIFDTVEEAARAYNEAVCLLRGSNTRTNFWPCSPSSNSSHALPSKITNLFVHRLKARNNASCSASSTFVSCSSHANQILQNQEDNIESNKFTVPGDNKCTGTDHHQQASIDEREMGEEYIDVGIVDFHFMDDVRSSCCYYLPFEIAKEMVDEQESYGGEEEEPFGLTEAMKRMKYEHKFL